MVWSDGTLTALIAPDRLPSPALSPQEGLTKLDEIWGRSDLGRLPIAWGLADGARVDFLGVHLDCPSGGEARLTWRAGGRGLRFVFSAATGMNLLPLDLWPSEAASPATSALNFTLSLPDACVVSSAGDAQMGVALWARKGA